MPAPNHPADPDPLLQARAMNEEAFGASDDGGPAFPQNDLSGYGIGPAERNNGGMTLRDWFAGQPDATGSLIAIDKEVCEKLCGPAPEMDDTINLFKWQAKVLATLRYIAADAMLAARLA